MSLPEKHLLCTGHSFKRIGPVPSLFFKKSDLAHLNEGWLRSPSFLPLAHTEQESQEDCYFEVCWVGLSTDYIPIDSNSHKSLE